MPLLILLPGVIAISLGKVLCSYLGGIGKPVFATYASLAALIVNIGLNVLLIPKWGIAGAALATSISYSLDTVIIFIVFSKLAKIKPIDILVVKLEDIKSYLRIARNLRQTVFAKSK